MSPLIFRCDNCHREVEVYVWNSDRDRTCNSCGVDGCEDCLSLGSCDDCRDEDELIDDPEVEG